MKNYLPSKKFTYSVLAIIILGILFLVISNLISKKNHFSATNENGQLEPASLTINDMLQKDSDGDGVADWEEALWGTDPHKPATFGGVADADYIKQKKDALEIADNASSTPGASLSETDKFAQEFFASLTAMKQSGQMDASTINNVSTALGQEIANPTLTDKYESQDAKIADQDSPDAQKTYYLSIKKLFEEYKKRGIGDEVQITSILANNADSGITTGDKSKYAGQLTKIASAYQEYATKIMEVFVPQSLAQYHLEIANSANNTGVAVSNMTKIIDDPVVGLSGLSQYQKYSDDLISSVGNLETILYNNGISAGGN